MIVVAASGGFDPLHLGHCEMLMRARDLGDYLVVIVNSDDFLVRKKGYCFMPLEDRLRIIRALKFVNEAVVCIDTDDTVRQTLRVVKPHVFANGGDRTSHDSPERPVCEELGIRMVDGLGSKVRSSSDLVNSIMEKQRR